MPAIQMSNVFDTSTKLTMLAIKILAHLFPHHLHANNAFDQYLRFNSLLKKSLLDALASLQISPVSESVSH